jgi:hypothetical protein
LAVIEPVDLAGIGKEEHVVLGGGNEQMHHEVFVPGLDARLPLAAPALGPRRLAPCL